MLQDDARTAATQVLVAICLECLISALQIGNAVCPLVASALGRCLAQAASGKAEQGVSNTVASVPCGRFNAVRPCLLSLGQT